jgi:hypothetical protein
MNWPAGILAFALIYVPMSIVAYVLYKRNQEIEHEYKQRINNL